jgi:transcriptional regulator
MGNATMYVPPQFKEDRVPVLHAAMRQAGLATLVTFAGDGLEASHVPMLLDPEPAPFGTLYGHISRANAQWRQSRADIPALAIFLGPDAYISPSWYETKRQTGKVVPTWNYVAIHAAGPVRFFHDPDQLLALVTRLTERHEGERTEPWAVRDAPEEFISAQLKGIVGFALSITRLEGKWKMGQNRPLADRRGAVDGLLREGGPAEAAAAGVMAGEAGPWRG